MALYLYHRCLSSSRRRAPRLKWRPQQRRCLSRSRVRHCSASQRSASPSCSGGPPDWRATCWPADGTACATPHSKHSSWTLESRWPPGSGSVRAHRGFGSGRLHRDWSAARDTATDSATFASGRAPVPTTGTSWPSELTTIITAGSVVFSSGVSVITDGRLMILMTAGGSELESRNVCPVNEKHPRWAGHHGKCS